MDSSRWKVVNRIFHAALDLPASDRKPFVVAESNGDVDLQFEVERLLQADEAADSRYLESPLIDNSAPHRIRSSEPALRPGTLLDKRFSILRLVGEGGMGQVYEARDRELRVSVALKVIRPEIASHPEAVARFRQEVRLARRITHPNICRIYDLNRETLVCSDGSSAELLYLTMEFLNGETLADRIQRAGALSPEESLEIARQMAAGLDAAHDIGVIHRDIKPANIHLVVGKRGAQACTRVVITDFGLARLDPVQMEAELSSPTSLARPIGTLCYMAPEQLENGSVSAATDVYAFGLVLFEMITGARAFPPSSLLSGIAQRLNGRTPSAQAVVAEVSAAWEKVIQGCLHLDPAERFPAAADAVKVLEGGQSRLPAVRRAAEAARSYPRSKWGAIVAAICVALALLATGFRYYQWKAQSSVTAGALIYLAPVRNATGDHSLDNLTELIQAGLTQSAHITLLDRSRVGDILQQMTKAPETPITEPVAREIAMRGGAVRAIFPTVSREGRDFRLDIDIQQPDNTPSRYRNHWTNSFAWSAPQPASGQIPQDLLRAVRNSSDWIRHEVGESANDIARLDVPPEDATTSSWEALEEYIRAERLQGEEQTNRAVDALQNAVRLDPEFATAFARLGDLLVATGHYEQGYDSYRRALDLNQTSRLTRKEIDRIQGEFAYDSFDFEAAEAAYRDYSEYYQNDYIGWNFRGYPLVLMDRTDEAITVLQKAYSIDPSRSNAPFELGRAAIAARNFSEALHWASVLSSQGELGISNYLIGVVRFLKGDYPGALAAFEAIRQSRAVEDSSWRYLQLAEAQADLGKPEQADASLTAGMEVDRQNGFFANLSEKLIARSYLEARAGNYQLCLRDIRAALALDASPVRLLGASTSLGTAWLRAPGSARPSLLRELLEVANILPHTPEEISTIARLRLDGEVLLAKGDYQNALVQFRKASRMEAPAAGQEYLARALRLSAAHLTDARRQKMALAEAMQVYGLTALRPNLVWIQPIQPLPGIFRDQLVSYCDLASLLQVDNENARAARMAFSALGDKVAHNIRYSISHNASSHR
jgi:tetratricopeptide (TPR) repeat protein